MKKALKRFGVLAVLGGGAAFWYVSSRGEVEPPSIQTTAVTQGDIRDTVQATGALEAVTTVAVGSQVSGIVSWLGADFNSVVKQGQIIARLEPSLLEAQVEQARANLQRVNTDVRQRQMNLEDREAKYARAQQLWNQQLISRDELEAARLAAAAATMDLESTRAQVVQAQASLNQALVNLSHTTIRSPIDGIVIQRSVDVGQTVAASLSSPTLFLLVGDLTKMRVSAAIDESDIAQIQPGQPVNVTVDAFPGRRFPGTVAQVRLQPTVASNVTTYTTIVDVENPRRELMPGMTATAEIEVASRDNVVRVPNTALRFRPSAEVFAALGQAAPEQNPPGPRPATTGDASRAVRVSTRDGDDASGQAPAGTRGEVWVHENGALRRIPVRVGLSDGSHTELLSGDLTPGTEVVTAVVIPGASSATTPASPNRSVFGGSGGGRGRW
jgi:HlyD family secretion protein